MKISFWMALLATTCRNQMFLTSEYLIDTRLSSKNLISFAVVHETVQMTLSFLFRFILKVQIIFFYRENYFLGSCLSDFCFFFCFFCSFPSSYLFRFLYNILCDSLVLLYFISKLFKEASYFLHLVPRKIFYNASIFLPHHF